VPAVAIRSDEIESSMLINGVGSAISGISIRSLPLLSTSFPRTFLCIMPSTGARRA
jgi:hypothetical protein